MGDIHATINLSLDGCCDHTQVIADDEFHERISDLFDGTASLLFGSKTYALLHGYWPGVAASGEGTPGVLRLARILNEKPKYVVSSRDPASGWQARRTAPTRDAIAALRDQVDGTILLVASPTLARTVVQWGLVREYHVAVSPMVAGHGPHFLEGLEHFRASLLDVARLRSGVLILRYGFEGQGQGQGQGQG
jgi:dihydrofolate reductase